MPKKNYDNDNKLVGSIWIKESKKGTRYLSIALEDPEDEDRKFNLTAFKNREKRKDTSPDYFIFFDESAKDKKKSRRDDDEDDVEEDDDEL